MICGSVQQIGAVEQITQRSPAMRVHPSPAPMLGRIVDHVAALAERRQLVEGAVAVAGIVVEVGTGQHHGGPPAAGEQIVRPSPHAPPMRSPACSQARRLPFSAWTMSCRSFVEREPVDAGGLQRVAFL